MRGALLLLLMSVPVPVRAAGSDTVRVLIYNIHHGAGTDGRLDLERIAAVIRAQDPDVVLLQEPNHRAAWPVAALSTHALIPEVCYSSF